MKLAIVIATLLSGAIVPARLHSQRASQTKEIPVRLIVEPSYPPVFSQEITLTFTDASGTTVADALVSETVRATNFRPIRGGMSGEIRLQKDQTFPVLLPVGRSEFRLIVRIRPQPSVTSATGERYVVKSVQANGVNLLEKLLTIPTTFTGEVVITVAKCLDSKQVECK